MCVGQDGCSKAGIDEHDAPDVRELKMIFDGQNAIHQVMRSLLVKLDEVIGRQERELSMLTLINQQGPGHVQPGVC